MGQIFDLLQAAAGEASLSGALGRWRQGLSVSLDQIFAELCVNGIVTRFADLPAGAKNPEGITIDSAGNFYVTTASATAINAIYVFSPAGHFQFAIPIPGATPAITATTGATIDIIGRLFIANLGTGKVYRYDPPFSAASVPAQTYAVAGAPPVNLINGLLWTSTGTLLISDSLGGNIFELDPGTGVSSVYVNSAQLQPCAGAFPNTGANGMDFNADYSQLYVSNTGMDRILIVNAVTKAVTRFSESINGADGIRFDSTGKLWVAANQADEIVALDSSGRIVERRGCFKGIGPDGAVIGLLFPSSIVFKNNNIYITNFARAFGTTPGHPSEPEADVTLFTLAKTPVLGITPLHPLQ